VALPAKLAAAAAASRGGRAALDPEIGAKLAGGAAAALLGVLALILAPVMLFGGAATSCQSQGEGAFGPDEPDLEPIEIAVRVYDVGTAMRAPRPHVLAAFATVIVEAGGGVTMRNPMCYRPGECDADSVGAFQQRNIAPWNRRNRRNVREAARSFYEQARVADRPGMPVGDLAQAVQGSRYPDRYTLALPLAALFLDRVLALTPRQYARLAGRAAAGFAAAGQPGTTHFAEGTGGRDRLLPAARREPAAGVGTLAWPTVQGPVVSPFGPRWGRMHEGVDIAAPTGASVYAAASGVIVLEGFVSGYGNYVCIRHAPRFSTCYAHMSAFAGQPQGATIPQGAVIGRVGCTGHCFGPHLHFETRLSGGSADPAVDPMPYLRGASVAQGGEDGGPELAECMPEGGRPVSTAGGELAWPANRAGAIVGRPNVPGSTHDPNAWPDNWQSDNALDIALPLGRPIVAVEDGVICPSCGFGPSGSGGSFAGARLTLNIRGNQVYYAHLLRILARPGQRVGRGQVIATSGSANGVAHLHIAVRDGDAELLMTLRRGPAARPDTTTGQRGA
jgi:murein DD-endopeptidase MepM/ murein hydrolase activator NlpD